MPLLISLVAGASLFGSARVAFNALSAELTIPDDSTSDSESDAPAAIIVRRKLQEWGKSATSSLAQFEEEYHRFIRNEVDPLFGSKREAQMQDVEAAAEDGDVENADDVEDERPISPYERVINLNLGVSAGITVAAIATAPFNPVIQLAVTLPPALYVVQNVYKGAYKSVVQQRKLTLPVLSAVNVTALWLGGYHLLGGPVLLLIYLGMKLSFVTEDRSRKRLVSIFGNHPHKAWVLKDDVEIEVPFDQLQIGDLVVVGAGQMITADGVIVRGSGSIDQRVLTGESQPVDKSVGDDVLAATVVLGGHLVIRVKNAGKETVAAKIGEMLSKTASYQMDITTKAYRIANASVAPTLVAAAAALLTVGYSGMVAITSTVFGFNLSISGPMALLNYLNVSARQSILIKDGRSLEILTTIDTVVFDKTGTLTLEQPQVTQVYTFAGSGASDVVRYAATIEQRQSHPIAHAILAYAKERNVSLASLDDSRYEVGYGLRAEIDGKVIRVGSERFMTLEQVHLPPEAAALREKCHAIGNSLVMVAMGDELVGAIELAPTIRPEAKSVIEELRRRHLKLYIISGDQEGPTRLLAQTLGIDHYFANTLPEKKAEIVEQLQQQGRTVCFVGDGINDSIALKKANVSISLRGATSVATDTAQVVLMDSTLQQLTLLFTLADEMDANLKASLALAIIPGLGIWAGVFFGHLGILGAAAIYETSLWVGMANAFRPVFKYKQKVGES